MPRATGPPMLDNISMTRHVIWKNASGDSHDLWYDDPQTLAAKYAAAKSAGMRAVGMWTPDSVRWNKSAATAMWGALPAPNKTPRGCVGPQENRNWTDGVCVAPYPGKEWQHPKIHQSPDCLHLSGWHGKCSRSLCVFLRSSKKAAAQRRRLHTVLRRVSTPPEAPLPRSALPLTPARCCANAAASTRRA